MWGTQAQREENGRNERSGEAGPRVLLKVGRNPTVELAGRSKLNPYCRMKAHSDCHPMCLLKALD